MPLPAPTTTDIYQFAANFESGFRTVLEASGFKVLTLENARFQKDRPRIELRFQLGSDQNNFDLPVISGDQQAREVGFTGVLTVQAVSNAQAEDLDAKGNPLGTNPGVVQHRTYVATVMDTMAGLYAKMAVQAIHPYYSVSRVSCAGHSLIAKTEDGYLVTEINYNITFVILPAAWPTS